MLIYCTITNIIYGLAGVQREEEEEEKSPSDNWNATVQSVYDFFCLPRPPLSSVLADMEKYLFYMFVIRLNKLHTRRDAAKRLTWSRAIIACLLIINWRVFFGQCPCPFAVHLSTSSRRANNSRSDIVMMMCHYYETVVRLCALLMVVE